MCPITRWYCDLLDCGGTICENHNIGRLAELQYFEKVSHHINSPHYIIAQR